MEAQLQATTYDGLLNQMQAAGRVSGGIKAKPNILSALDRGLPHLIPGFLPHDGHFVVVGSGPSLSTQVDSIIAEKELGRPVVAVKGAHDYLCERGLIPDIFVSTEIEPRLSQITKANQQTIYLLATRCAPEMFDALLEKKCKVMVFNAHNEKESFPEMVGQLLIGGGTTSGLRAVTIGYVLGFRNFILYGFDSCLAEDLRKRVTDTKGLEPEKTVDRIVGGRRFICNYAMAIQADEFQMYYSCFGDIHFEVKGGGLIAAIIEERKRLGKRT